MSYDLIAGELTRLRHACAASRTAANSPGVSAGLCGGLLRAAPAEHAPRLARVGGYRVAYADPPSLKTQVKDIFEQRIYDFASSRPDPFIIDGGASIGLATLYWKRAFPAARVVCFEPDPQAAALLRRNIEDNGLKRVEIVRAALADHGAAAAIEPDGADGGRLIDRPTVAPGPSGTGGAAPHGVISVPTARLSDHIGEAEPVDLLKLNVEGAEWPVLRELEAAGKLRLVQRIILEYHGRHDEPPRLADILDLLDRGGHRYLIHDFDRQTNPATKPPFRLRPGVPWFCLVYAERSDGGRPGASRPGDEQRPRNADRAEPRSSGRLADWRRLTPISRVFGLDRGTPIDRYWIERFLADHAGDIRGNVLEVGGDEYTRRFGAGRVGRSDVLFAPPGHRRATIIADIGRPRALPEAVFDCIILTQTLHCIYDIKTAVENCRRALRPGGVLLATVPGISQISRYDMDRWGDFWRLTTAAARRLFGDIFPPSGVAVSARGNVLAAAAFLHGLPAEQLEPFELDHRDADYEALISIRAVKPA